MMSHLYDIMRNPNYLVGKPFPYQTVMISYLPRQHFWTVAELKRGPQCTTADDGFEGEGGNINPGNQRLIWKKTAKKRKRENKGMNKSADNIAASMTRFESSFSATQDKKRQLVEDGMAL